MGYPRRCNATTARGNRCTRRPTADGRCNLHQTGDYHRKPRQVTGTNLWSVIDWLKTATKREKELIAYLTTGS